MSENENIDNELKDVELCYKGMGIPFDSSPDEVERAYRSLTERFKRDMLSPDLDKRLKAKEDIEVVNNLYGKIKNSVNYQRKLRERGYAPDELEGSQKRRTEASGTRIILKICPSCNNSINGHLKVCPICKKRVYSSKFEKIWVENISKNMLLTISIISILALVILIATNFREIIGFITH
jgi:hypothetical protein